MLQPRWLQHYPRHRRTQRGDAATTYQGCSAPQTHRDAQANPQQQSETSPNKYRQEQSSPQKVQITTLHKPKFKTGWQQIRHFCSYHHTDHNATWNNWNRPNTVTLSNKEQRMLSAPNKFKPASTHTPQSQSYQKTQWQDCIQQSECVASKSTCKFEQKSATRIHVATHTTKAANSIVNEKRNKYRQTNTKHNLET